MTPPITIDGRTVHLSPTAAAALARCATDTDAGRTIDPGTIHPACRRRLYDLGLLGIALDGAVILTATGLDAVTQLREGTA